MPNICKRTIHQKTRKSASSYGQGLKLDHEHWYDHVPKSVERSREGKVNILWNQINRTNRTIPNNKPDTIIRDNEKGTYMLIEVVIYGDGNVIKKEAEKILTYRCFIIEIQPMWNVKKKVVPVIIVATATISNLLRQHQNNLLGKNEIKELKKNSHIRHCTHTSEVLM